MHDVKNLETGEQFFQMYNFMNNLFGKGRLKLALSRLCLRPSWKG
ncbi:MAG: hypothetical protein ACUVQM_02670 [Candidatus Hadarchaeaceae archaeon]